MSNWSVDGKEILVRLIKYLLEGIVVGVAVFLIPAKKPSLEEILTVGLIAAAVFSLLDLFSPSVAASARSGAGAGIGLGLVGGLPIAH